MHPAAKGTLGGDEGVVRERLLEENEAKRALIELEKIDVDSSEFSVGLRRVAGYAPRACQLRGA